MSAAAHALVDFGWLEQQLDLGTRIARIPPSAAVRGVFYNQVEDSVRRSLGVISSPLRVALGPQPRSFEMASAREFVRMCAIGGAMVDRDPRVGMRRVGHEMVDFFSSSWFGRAFRRFLRPDPIEAIRWVERSRDHISNYGSVRLETRGPGRATIHFYDEYSWLDTLQLGGVESLLEACGVRGEVVPHLDDIFRGRFEVRWS